MDPNERVWRDRGLRSAVLAGDKQAWKTWYEESYPALFAYIAWRCAGLDDLAEEIVQETWLTAVRRIRSFEPERAEFASWLRGIAANLLRNHLRSRTRHGQTRELGNGQHVPARLADPDCEREEQSECIARALAGLPEHYEAVLRAKYLEQQSVEQIASNLHQTPKAIESLLTRARQAFREEYGKRE
jgi:RNA polymerase sigma-70 factor (ECF subfamily)